MSISKLLLSLPCAAFIVTLAAQTPAPTAYTVSEFNAMFGPPGVNMIVYRDGAKALVEQSPAPGGSGSHTRSFYDLNAHSNLSWDTSNPGNGCSRGTFSGDWGDPFAMSAEVAKSNAKQTGTENLNGTATKVMEAEFAGGKLKAWVDTKSGLVMKVQMSQGSAAPQTMLEVKQLTIGKPAASMFTLPPACAAAAAAPPVPTEAQRIAAETGGNAADFTNAVLGPGSPNSCSVYVRVMHAGTMQPIIGGFQIAIDTTYNVDHPPHYTFGMSADGKTTYSGGGIREMTGQLRNGVLRIDNPPPYFEIETQFGKGGSSGGLIYRQCSGPQSVLLLVVKNSDRLSDGADWLWAKSGKFASADSLR